MEPEGFHLSFEVKIWEERFQDSLSAVFGSTRRERLASIRLPAIVHTLLPPTPSLSANVRSGTGRSPPIAFQTRFHQPSRAVTPRTKFFLDFRLRRGLAPPYISISAPWQLSSDLHHNHVLCYYSSFNVEFSPYSSYANPPLAQFLERPLPHPKPHPFSQVCRHLTATERVVVTHTNLSHTHFSPHHRTQVCAVALPPSSPPIDNTPACARSTTVGNIHHRPTDIFGVSCMVSSFSKLRTLSREDQHPDGTRCS